MILWGWEESRKKPSFTQYCEVRWRWLSSQWEEGKQLQSKFPEMQGQTTHHWVLEKSYILDPLISQWLYNAPKHSQVSKRKISQLKCNPLKLKKKKENKAPAEHNTDTWHQDKSGWYTRNITRSIPTLLWVGCYLLNILFRSLSWKTRNLE